MIDGVEVTVDREPLVVLSSAVVGGGLAAARAVLNLHVPKDVELGDLDARLDAFVRRRGVPAPWVGLLTSAWTEKAEGAEAQAHDIRAVAVVTVGLSNRVAAGVDGAAAWAPSTINTIVVVDAAPEPAAMVNVIITATEVKTALLGEAGVKRSGGLPASGTSTDAVVVAATAHGRACRFGGPVSELGSVVARAVRAAMGRGILRWLEDNA